MIEHRIETLSEGQILSYLSQNSWSLLEFTCLLRGVNTIELTRLYLSPLDVDISDKVDDPLMLAHERVVECEMELDALPVMKVKSADLEAAFFSRFNNEGRILCDTYGWIVGCVKSELNGFFAEGLIEDPDLLENYMVRELAEASIKLLSGQTKQELPEYYIPLLEKTLVEYEPHVMLNCLFLTAGAILFDNHLPLKESLALPPRVWCQWWTKSGKDVPSYLKKLTKPAPLNATQWMRMKRELLDEIRWLVKALVHFGLRTRNRDLMPIDNLVTKADSKIMPTPVAKWFEKLAESLPFQGCNPPKKRRLCQVISPEERAE
jgi:hypothetical protein